MFHQYTEKLRHLAHYPLVHETYDRFKDNQADSLAYRAYTLR